MTVDQKGHLKRVLKPVRLCAIAVGLVISGEYPGWNLVDDVLFEKAAVLIETE